MAESFGDESVRTQIQEWLAAGRPAPEVERLLQERGISAAEAAQLIDEVFGDSVGAETAKLRSLERADLVRGTLWCVGGLVIFAGGIAMFNANGKIPGYSLFAASAAAIARGAMVIIKAMT